jgi:hypothetical protein
MSDRLGWKEVKPGEARHLKLLMCLDSLVAFLAMQGIVGLDVGCDFCFVKVNIVFFHNPAVLACCLLGLLFDPEEGGSTLLQMFVNLY